MKDFLLRLLLAALLTLLSLALTSSAQAQYSNEDPGAASSVTTAHDHVAMAATR